MTTIRACDCEQEFQDKKYGKGKRIHNEAKGKTGTKAWRCTGCGVRKEG